MLHDPTALLPMQESVVHIAQEPLLALTVSPDDVGTENPVYLSN